MLLENLLAEHDPATETERLLVQAMATHHERECHAQTLQAEALERGDLAALPILLRYETHHHRAFHKSLAMLLKLQKARRLTVPLGHARRSDLTPEERQRLAVEFKTDMQTEIFGATLLTDPLHPQPVPLAPHLTRYIQRMASIGIAVTVTWDDTLPNGALDVDDATETTLHLRSRRTVA